MAENSDPSVLAEALLRWYRRCARNLPWRHTGKERADPYKIWVSELMLQQTRVDTVLKRWADFLARFGDVPTLAAADEEAVRAAWSGLGYYRRARNLHLGAKILVERHGGVIPDDVEAVSALPGVGRYTLGAIMSHAFNRRMPILDGNVIRVLARLFRVAGDPKKSATNKQLWQLAEEVLPEYNCGDFNQALMDLGATICTPRNAACLECPLTRYCGAFIHAEVDRYPQQSKKTKVLAVRRAALYLRRDDDAVLLVQRPAEGLLADLWELPAADLPSGAEALTTVLGLMRACRAEGSDAPTELGEAQHRFSHRHWKVRVFGAQVGSATRGPDGARAWRWVLPAEMDGLGIPTVTVKILAAAGHQGAAATNRGEADARSNRP